MIGATDPKADHPVDRPLKPVDLWATVYRFLGIDYRYSLARYIRTADADSALGRTDSRVAVDLKFCCSLDDLSRLEDRAGSPPACPGDICREAAANCRPARADWQPRLRDPRWWPCVLWRGSQCGRLFA